MIWNNLLKRFFQPHNLILTHSSKNRQQHHRLAAVLECVLERLMPAMMILKQIARMQLCRQIGKTCTHTHTHTVLCSNIAKDRQNVHVFILASSQPSRSLIWMDRKRILRLFRTLWCIWYAGECWIYTKWRMEECFFGFFFFILIFILWWWLTAVSVVMRIVNGGTT